MSKLEKAFEKTWEDFQRLYLAKCRGGRSGRIVYFGWFSTEADIRFHFARMFYDNLDRKTQEKVLVKMESSFNPKDWVPLKRKMQQVLKKIRNKAANMEPEIDLVICSKKTWEEVKKFADICTEFKYFHIIRGGYVHKSKYKFEVDLKKDIERLDEIKKAGLAKQCYMCIVDEWYHRQPKYAKEFQKLSNEFPHVKILHFKVSLDDIQKAIDSGF